MHYWDELKHTVRFALTHMNTEEDIEELVKFF